MAAPVPGEERARDLGERAGFSGKYISEVERGLRDLPLSSLRAIAHQALGASFEQVFRGLESQPLLARWETYRARALERVRP